MALNKPLESIKESDLQALVDNQVTERKTIEYKEALPKNAAGGERELIELLGQPKAYIGDLKQSLQPHRHAETQARIKLSYQQCLERTTKIIEMYIALSERPSS